MSERSDIAVNVAGFLRGGLGLGEAARLYVAALQAAGVPLTTTTIDVPLPDREQAVRKETDFLDVAGDGDAPFNLICVNAPELPLFYQDVGPSFFHGRYSIGVWAWEVDRIPDDWNWSFTAVDEIWCYSRYVEGLLRPVSPVPIVRVPLPIVAPRIEVKPPELGLDADRFTFLLLFDFYSTMQRKNPLGLVAAFKRAFRAGEGPQLLVKSFNGDYKPERLARLRAAADDHPDVHVVDRFVTTAEKDSLIAACDCYVSLHRSEGFGLPLGEAMALGRPVLATGYSGNLDFMSEQNSWLVRSGVTRVGLEGENYPSDGTWGEPDLDHAAQLMHQLWENPALRAEKAERARDDVHEHFSLERVGEIALERLERIVEEGRAAGPAPHPPPAGTAWKSLQRAQWKLDFDPLATARRGGGPKNAARIAALRAMRPYTYHQEELNQELFRSIREVAERLDHLSWKLEAQAGLDERGRAHLRRVLAAVQTRPAPHHPLLSRHSSEGRVLAFEGAGEASDDPYADFEDIFRGSERLVYLRQAQYADLLAGGDWVLEVGCGRGEFLDLLRERGIEGRGVDMDAGMVERARAKGHEVGHADAVEYLRGLDDGSVPAIYGSQFIEHLGADVLVKLLKVSAMKLAPGGTAIFETMNPHSPLAMKAFWVDPTHHHPLFPEVLLAFSRFAGFESGRVTFPDASGDFDHDVYASPDYAVVLTARGG